MPSDESLLQQAEQFKTSGNQEFQKGNLKEAISDYSQGIVACDRIVPSSSTAPAAALVKAALLSNRAMCYLKGGRFDSCIEDCTTAITMDHHHLQDVKLRTKLFYRRAKGRFLRTSLEDQPAKEREDMIQDAAKDLLMLLQVDPKNTEAKQLLTTIRALHHQNKQNSAVTPVAKTIDVLKELQNPTMTTTTTVHHADGTSTTTSPTKKPKEAEVLKHVKILLGCIDNDIHNTCMELGRLPGAISFLLSLAVDYCHSKTGTLTMQCISRGASHPPFVQKCLKSFQGEIRDVIQRVCENSQQSETEDAEGEPGSINSDLLVSALASLVRIILHTDRDDPKTEIVGGSALDYKAILQSCVICLNSCPNDKSVIRAVLDVLSTWTCGVDRDAAARASLSGAGATDPTLPIPKTVDDIRVMTPKELADHRKRESAKKSRDLSWAFERSMMFCGQTNNQREDPNSGIRAFIRAACLCEDHIVRREMTVVLGRILSALEGDDDDDGPGDKIKEVMGPFLKAVKPKDEGFSIKEVYNEDDYDEEKQQIEEIDVVPLETKMAHALITASLLLAKKNIGAWALGTGWTDSSQELPDLIESENPRAMCLASEVLSGAASVETSRVMVGSLVSSGAMQKLMTSDDRDIRSGAASAITKLGLSNKSTEEAERIGLLQAACDLLEERGENETATKVDDKLQKFTSFAGSSVDRAIEMLTYLVANTEVKEELAHGFHVPGAPTSALERLVAVADLPNAGESLSGFGLATVFHHLAVTNLQLRREAFEGREVTMEQYDEMQKMGKTEEEKEIMESEKDTDSEFLCKERIRKMAAANVPRALVKLMEDASEKTLQQLVLAISRFATETSTRGVMIQQGILSALIKVEKNEGPTTTETMKKVIRIARHSLARLLISTNPGLLTSAQRLGSIRPLIQLIRDISASDLQHFEALLAVTNVASSGDDAQNRIISERGIATFHYAMFSDHELVRRAATEAMCNLVPHDKMMDHLRDPENLKLFLAFAADYEENYECARAASGCLAMATQDESIALVFVKLERFRDNTNAMMESGRLEIMYRAMVTVLNLVTHGGKAKEKAISEGMVAFCDAYVSSYHANQQPADTEFTPEERALLPVTVDIAKKIVRAAE